MRPESSIEDNNESSFALLTGVDIGEMFQRHGMWKMGLWASAVLTYGFFDMVTTSIGLGLDVAYERNPVGHWVWDMAGIPGLWVWKGTVIVFLYVATETASQRLYGDGNWVGKSLELAIPTLMLLAGLWAMTNNVLVLTS